MCSGLRLSLILTTLLATAGFRTQVTSTQETRPNVVLIVADDLGWMDTGFQGSTYYRTPNIDRLAQQGMVFSQFYAASPVCSPSRASILTGLSPARLWLTKAITAHDLDRTPGPGVSTDRSLKTVSPTPRDHLPLDSTTLAERLQAAGYATAHIGKWHLGPSHKTPIEQGFDLSLGSGPAGRPSSYFPPYYLWNLRQAPEGEYLTDRLTDEAVAFIEKHRDRPFFLYLSHWAVHSPLMAKPELVEQYTRSADPSAAQNNPIYAAMIHSLDESVGRVMEAVSAADLQRRTIVIFTSDNGGALLVRDQDGFGPMTTVTSNLPLRSGKGRLYEGGIRVPAVFVWTGTIPTGSRSNTPAISTDLYPTILELAGVDRDDDTDLDGLSLAPILRDSKPVKRDALFWHFPHLNRDSSSAIREGDLKLIHFYETGDELYDLATDIGETEDLSRLRPDVVERLQKRLEDWLEETDAQMPTPNPNYEVPSSSSFRDPDPHPASTP